MSTKVPKVAGVNIELIRGDSQQLFVVASARVPTYPNIVAQLNPYLYLVPPDDGVYDFDFTANIPEGIVPSNAADVVITAAALIASPPTTPVKGVRVHASTNNIVMRVPTVTNSAAPVSDDFNITRAEAKDDKLIVNVQYSGGCARHDFDLRWDGTYLESFPPQVLMRIVHNSNGDPCDALPIEELKFDMLDLAPCVIKLSSDFGYASSIPFKLAAPHPPALIPFGPGGIPIIDYTILRLLVSLLQDNAALKQFSADPVGAMRTAGLTDEQISFFRHAANNGGAGILNGSTGILSRLGVRQEVLDAFCQ